MKIKNVLKELNLKYQVCENFYQVSFEGANNILIVKINEIENNIQFYVRNFLDLTEDEANNKSKIIIGSIFKEDGDTKFSYRYIMPEKGLDKEAMYNVLLEICKIFSEYGDNMNG